MYLVRPTFLCYSSIDLVKTIPSVIVLALQTMAPSAVYPEEYKTVETTLNHYLDPKLGGHDHYVTGTASYYRRKFDERPVRISNIRGREDEFDLNTQGFQFCESPTVGGDFRDNDKVKKEVYPETEKLLKEV